LIKLTVNNFEVSVEDGSTVATAVLAAGANTFRRSVTGRPRGPLCGMGICFECRVVIDGIPLQRSCTELAADGMEVTTDE